MKGKFLLTALASALMMCNTNLMAADDSSHLVNNQEKIKKLNSVKIEADVEKQSLHPATKTLTAEDIDNQQASDIDDLVRYIPGVTVSDIGRFGTNGFNIRGLDGDRVAMTIDGLSMGETLDPASYQAYDFFRSTRGGLDVDALKSVEILKGSDSIASGSGGLSGAVMFVTKDPNDYLTRGGDDTFVSVKTGYADENYETLLSGTLANRLGNWESLLVLTQRQSSELNVARDGHNITGAKREIPDPVDIETQNGLIKLFYNINDKHRLGLVGEFYRANSQLNNLTRVDATYLSRNTDDNNERDRLGVTYQWTAELGLFDILNWNYNYQTSFNQGYTLMLFKSSTCPQATSPCLRSEDRHYEQESHTTDFTFSKFLNSDSLNQTITYRFGFEDRDVSYESVDTRYLGITDTKALVEIEPDFVPETQVNHFHAYISDQLKPESSPWEFRLGLRADRYDYSPEFNTQFQDKSGTISDVSFDKLTWQLGTDFHLNEDHSLGLQIGTGFRAPTTENLYYATVTSPAIDVATGQEIQLWDSVSNPDLKPEESLNKEINYTWETQQQRTRLAVFHDDYSDFIENTNLTRLTDSQFQTCTRGVCTTTVGDQYTMPLNAGEVTVKGVEIDSRWILNSNWLLRATVSYTNGEKKNGDPLLSLAPHSGVLGLDYQTDDKRFAAGLNITRSAGKHDRDVLITNNNGNQVQGTEFLTEGYTLLDFQSRYQLTSEVKLTFGIYNITDQQYWRWQRVQFVTKGTGGARGGVDGDGINRYAEPGRNFKISVSYSF